MKTKFLFVAALITMVFASCQKEESDCAVQPGLDTYAGMTISIPKELVQSRALVDGTTQESTIKTVKVGTWSDGNLAITYTTLNGSDFTDDGSGNYVATKAIKAKTGKTNFIVIANSTDELTLTQVNGEPFTRTVAQITTDNNFTMYSREVNSLLNVQMASQADVESATSGDPLYTTNRTSVTLRRAAAKIEVSSSLATTDATGVPAAPPTPTGVSNGKLYDIKWNIANQNGVMTAIVNKLDKAGAFTVKNVNSPFSKVTNEIPTLIVPKTGIAASSAYCLENSNGRDVYTEANTTAVHVTAVFAPAKGTYIYSIGGTVLAPVIVVAAEDMGKGGTFYVLKKAFIGLPAGTFMSSEAILELQGLLGITLDNDDAGKYIRGLCHWPIYIHDGSSNYGVLRNHIYGMNIKSIKAPGFAEFPEGPDKPISTNAFIEVDLTIKAWANHNMGNVEK